MSSVRSTAASGSAVYESARAVDEYYQFHFGKPEDVLPYKQGPAEALRFPERCAQLCIDAIADASTQSHGTQERRALDVGCAVGGASFALSKGFDEVLGIDFSQAFVDAAEAMRSEQQCSYSSLVEGDSFQQQQAHLPAGVRTERVAFAQGDACALSTDALGQFDAVLASNLLCRLPDPRAFLAVLPQLVKPQGVAVIISPYSWLPEYTQRQHWLVQPHASSSNSSSTAPSNTAASSFAALRSIMESNGAFALEARSDMPFLIREHARKFQWGISDATVWRRSAGC